MKSKLPVSFGVMLYILGALAGFALVFFGGWANMEANFYGFPRQADPGLAGFSCPLLISRGDSAFLSFSITNTTDSRVSPSVKVWISSPVLLDEHVERMDLAPGESKHFKWQVDAKNVDLGRFIFAKAMLYSSYPLPSQDATCGIFVLDLPVSGRVILPALVAISILGMGWGLFEMYKARGASEWNDKNFPALIFMSIVLALGLALSFGRAWI